MVSYNKIAHLEVILNTEHCRHFGSLGLTVKMSIMKIGEILYFYVRHKIKYISLKTKISKFKNLGSWG